ncbi:protein disulfide-isomerase A4 [Carettochelys insculpta]|uniref:protein disulfide-isomerase A4 n=1 Tax=Carettochelys insculpta TaxID=44489 RepID=UPI003EBFA5A3
MEVRRLCLLLALLLGLAQLALLANAQGEEGDGESVTKEDADDDDDNDNDDDEDEDEDDSEVKEENGVIVLNDANFDTFTAGKDTVLLEFYAPWCGHCKQFAPEYEKIAKTLKENDPPIPVVKIDATAATALASRFDVSGYPTIKILKNGQAIDYDGPRTEDAIVAKVKEVSDPNWTPPPEVTLVLTKENFDEVVNEADIILVEFYAPWCGHCKRLAPEYEKAAQELNKRTPPIPLAKVDAIAETDLAKKFDVTGYPTLKIFRKGKPFDYNGPREKYGIVDYMIEQAGPPSKQIQATKQVQEFLKDGDDVIIIGIFSGEMDKAFQVYQDAANGLREDYKFHHTFSSEIAKFLKVTPSKLVVMQPEKFQSKHEPKMNVLDLKDSTTGSEIKDHVIKHALPLVGHRKTSNDAKRYAKRPLVVVYYMVDFSFDYRVATQYWRSKVLEVAKDFPEYTFAISDEEDYSSEIKDMGLIDSGEDVNVAILDEGGKKYAMEPEEFDSDVLRNFILAFKKGKLKPIVKSQPIPKNNKGPVKIVVGKTFDTIVMDPNTDVLLEFYAPWCGHCKQLEPIYTELGKKYKNQKNLVIAKMDATANDVTNDHYKVEGFPTIYFAPSNNKNNPVRFEGGNRDLEHLSKFVEEHATKLTRTKEEL